MTQFRPRNFQVLPLVIKNLVIINVLIFLLEEVLRSRGLKEGLNELFALHHFQSPFFKPHQLITHMFMHHDWGHLFFNMFALWMFGSVLENYWGPKRFLAFYILCGLGAALFHEGVLAYQFNSLINDAEAFRLNPTAANFVDFYNNHIRGEIFDYNGVARSIADNWIADPSKSYIYLESALEQIQDQIMVMNYSATVGASGAVFGCLAAFAYLFPNSYIYIYFLFPMKVKWFVLIYAAIELIAAFQNDAGDNVAHWAHLGGALVGFLIVIYWNKTQRRTFY